LRIRPAAQALDRHIAWSLRQQWQGPRALRGRECRAFGQELFNTDDDLGRIGIRRRPKEAGAPRPTPEQGTT
jgi:hypothetical protein